jgi:hypothetical protein
VIFVENNLKSTNLSIRRAASTHGNIIFVSTVLRNGLENQINYDSTTNGIFILAIGPAMYFSSFGYAERKCEENSLDK